MSEHFSFAFLTIITELCNATNASSRNPNVILLCFKMASSFSVIFQKRVRVFYWGFQTRENFILVECLETPVKHKVRVFEMASLSAPKARVKRRTSHEPNRMQMRKIFCCPSIALDSAHVKYGF